jgi:hypothetical protein
MKPHIVGLLVVIIFSACISTKRLGNKQNLPLLSTDSFQTDLFFLTAEKRLAYFYS